MTMLVLPRRAAMRYFTLSFFAFCFAGCATTLPSERGTTGGTTGGATGTTSNNVAPTVAPKTLLADPGSNQVSLSWKSDPSYDSSVSYWVQRRGATGAFVDLAEVNQTSYTDTQAVNGQLYYYTVLAVNGDARGPTATPVTARPLAMFTGWTEDLYYPTLRRSAYSGGLQHFVAVGDRGTVEVSVVADTQFSKLADSPITDDLTDVAASDSAFVAVGPGDVMLNSTDGNTWLALRNNDLTSTPAAVLYDGTRFISAAGCRVSTSNDGSNWTDAGSCGDGVTRPSLSRLVKAGTGYMGIDSIGVWQSSDLSHWSLVATQSGLEDLAVRGSDVLAIGCKTGVMIASGTPQTLSETQCWHGAASDGTNFIASGDGGEIARSTDGQTWSDESININTNTQDPTTVSTGTEFDPADRTFYDLSVLGSEDVVAVGEGNTILHRGITEPAWDNVQLGYASAIESVAQSPSVIVGVGPEWQQGSVLMSTDGLGWLRTPTVWPVHAVVYNGSEFVIAGEKGYLATTSDGKSLTAYTAITTQNYRAIAQGNNLTVIVGDAGTVATSLSNSFVLRSSGVNTDLTAVAYGNSTYVAAGKGGIVMVSADALTWKATTSNTTEDFVSLSFVTNQFAGVTADGSIYTSQNGTSWQRYQVAPGVVAVTEYANLWYAWGGSDFYTSSDLTVWSHKKEPIWRGANALQQFNGRWLEFGSGEQIEAQASAAQPQ